MRLGFPIVVLLILFFFRRRPVRETPRIPAVPPVEILRIQPDPDPVGVCQICGMSMCEDVVLCVRCRTPHHSSCWRYAGKCSTYACGERRYLREGRIVHPTKRNLPVQTPDEWLQEELERDRREMRRKAG